MEIISREAAYIAGKRFYFTGSPCKNGHVAPRYISTGGCTGCLKRYVRRQNSFSRDLVPYATESLWRSKRLEPEHLKLLQSYLQQCLDAFCAHYLPPICQTCQGTNYVPLGDGTNNWKLCPDCPNDVPTSPPPEAQQAP